MDGLKNKEIVEVSPVLAAAKSGGMRKASVCVGSIGMLVMKDAIDIKLALIVGAIAIVGIVCQTLLDSGVLESWVRGRMAIKQWGTDTEG